MDEDIERLGRVAVDPELFDIACEVFAGMTDEQRDEYTLLDIAATAFVDWTAREQARWSDRDVEIVRALGARLWAMERLIATPWAPHLIDGDDEAARRAFCESVCAAELIEEDGEPAFRVLDIVSSSRPTSRQ